MPQPIVEKIVAAVNEALKDPNVRMLLEKQALQPAEPMSSQQIPELIEKDTPATPRSFRMPISG